MLFLSRNLNDFFQLNEYFFQWFYWYWIITILAYNLRKTDLIPMFINKISPQLDNINFGRILRRTFYNIQNQYSIKPIFKMAGTNLKKNSSVPLTVTISGLDTLTGLESSTYIRDSKWEEWKDEGNSLCWMRKKCIIQAGL